MTEYLLQENSDYILQETGDKIILQEGTSPSISVSASVSPSPSPSISVSASESPSASISRSPSVTLSISTSISSSPSKSISASPSLGYSLYTREDKTTLPTNDDDLSTIYTDDEETLISTRNNMYVGQTGILKYMVHQFKKYVGDYTFVSVECEGRSSLSPTDSTVYLQVFNHTTSEWDTIDTQTEGFMDVNFELSAKVSNLTDYVEDRIISCRVYQFATE